MARPPDDSNVVDSLVVVGQELRRRNASTVAVDLLYLFTIAFLATLALRGFWPAAIATLPLVSFLYFAWHASRPFFVANVGAIVFAVVATEWNLLPL